MKTKQQQIFHYLLRSYGRVVKKASKVWQKGVKMVSKVWRFAHPTYTSVIYKKLKSLNLRLVISILVGIAGLVLAIKLLAPPITTYINTPRDLKLKNAADSTNYLYTAGSENLDIFVGEKKSYRPTVTLKNKEDSLISFTLSQTNDELSEPIRDGNVVTFENVRQGVDLKYQTLPNGIKEEIILTEKGQGNSFAFDTEINNANPKMMTNEFFGYIFYDQDDNYLFHFEKPFAVDGAGNRTDDVLLSVRRQAKEGNLYKIIVTVPLEWLNDPARVYPISIDPTVVHDTSAEFSPGQLNRNKDTGSGSFPSLETYYQELPADEHTVGLWHMNETSGTSVADSSGNGNTGTSGSSTNVTTGLLNNARSFNGTSDYISIPNTNQQSMSSITGWVKINSGSTTNQMFAQISQGAQQLKSSDADGTISMSSRISTWRTLDSNIDIRDSQWHHLSFVYDSSIGQKIYLDGKLVASDTSTGSLDDTGDANAGIGSSWNHSGNWLSGSIDEVRISNIARTPEEIKAAASRRPYSVYTSEVIDFADNITSWNDLSWDEWGVATGDGETLKDSTGLVAQWNFNEISGTTADNAEGTAALDGTLSGFDSTASQDADPDSSWTANNRRWGAGALQFDGVDSYVSVLDDNTLDFGTSDFSVSAWINTNTNNANTIIISKHDDGPPNTGWWLRVTSSGHFQFDTLESGNPSYIDSITAVNTGTWYHVVGIRDGTSLKIYVNGKLDNSTTDTLRNIDSTYPVNIGARNAGATQLFNGTIDSTRIYSRALPAHEILSNYNATNIEFQTRVGADTSPDDGDWDDWSSTTGETAIESFDSDESTNWSYRKAIAISHTGTAVTEYQVLIDGLDTSTFISNGKMQSDCGDLRFTNSSGAHLPYSIVDKTCNTTDTKIWVQTDSIPASGGATIYMFYGNPAANNYSSESDTFNYSSEKSVGYTLDTATTDLQVISLSPNNSISHNGSTLSLGKYQTGSFSTISKFAPITAKGLFNADDNTDNTDLFVPVSWAGTEFYFYTRDGAMDLDLLSPWGTATVTAYEGGAAISGCTSLSVTSAGSNVSCTGAGANVIRVSSDIPILLFVSGYNGGLGGDEMPVHPTTTQKWLGGGSASLVENGNASLDYRFYESTNASEQDLADATANTSNSTITGDGSYGSGASLVWSADSTTYGVHQYADADGGDSHYFNDVTEQGTIFGSANIADYISIASTQPATCSVYEADGTLKTTTTLTSSNTEVYHSLIDGNSTAYTTGAWYMTCDKPVVAHYQKVTASESNLMHYPMMRQFTYPTPAVGSPGTESTQASHTGSWIVTSANNVGTISLSSDTTLELEGTATEKITTGRLQVDNNTVGLWHLDETGGTGAYLKDSSGNDNHSTPVGTTLAQGIAGKARDFDGIDDYVQLIDDTSADALGTVFSISAWFKSETITGDTDGRIFTRDCSDFFCAYINQSTAFPQTMIVWADDTASNTFTGVISADWNQVTMTWDNTNVKTYLNGSLISTDAFTGFAASDRPILIGDNTEAAPSPGSSPFEGIIDEVMISDTTLTADQVAESYRMGRDHYLNKTISSTDLSGKSSLPFYIAADRPGSYLSATVGESAYANYQPDANTVGLWHLDDNRFKDSSGNGNDGNSLYGIDYGIRSSNLTLIANQWAGAANNGEMDITCTGGDAACAIVTVDGTTISTPSITNGVAMDESTVRDAYIMYSPSLINQGITAYAGNSDNYIGIRYNSGWQYDRNGGWYSFTPIDSNIIIASLSQGAPTITNLVQLTIQPISTQGKRGKARSFNGSSDYITLTDTTSISGNNARSISAWIKTTKTTAQAILATGTAATSEAFNLIVSYGTSGYFGVMGYGNDFYPSSGTKVTDGNWHYVSAVYDGNGTIQTYVDGELNATGSYSYSTTGQNNFIGKSNHGALPYYFNGSIDEVRIDNTTRTASEIRQAYEVGKRTHPITIDFGASLDSGNLIAGSGDLSFTVDATTRGLSAKGSALYLGDKIIVRENYDGTEYIAQGTVSAVTPSTGAVTVASWDAGSTFPSSGYTVNADVFKWQREYWPVADNTISDHMNAITNLTFRLTDGHEGRTIWLDDLRSNSAYLTDKTGSTITSSTGNQYFQYRAIMTSLDETVSATLSAVTLDYISNTAPSTPSLDLPTDTNTNQNILPVLKTTTTDADSDYLRYKIELCEDVGMTTNCNTYDQTSSQTGWSGQNTQTSTAYTSGTQAVYTLQSALAANDTFYWRSYAIDPGGTNTWSSTQTPYSFTTTAAPTAPTTPYAEGVTNPSAITDLTPELSAIHNDGNGDSANYYQIEVNTASDFTGTVMWDSTKTAMTTTANGVRSPDISYAGTSLALDGSTYYWRIKFWDTLGAQGAVSATQNFTMNSPSNTPSLDSPTNTATNQSLLPALKTTGTDTNSDYLRYKIELCEDVGMSVSCQTFNQTSSQTGWSGQNAQTSTAYTSGTQATYTLQSALSVNTTYYWRSYSIDPGGSNAWSSTQATPYSFTTTTAPTRQSDCRISEASDDSQNTIIWTDVSSNEDYFQVDRSTDASAWSTLSSTIPANSSSYIDSTITAEHTYYYRVAPYLSGGPTYGEWCYTDTLTQNLGSFKIN